MYHMRKSRLTLLLLITLLGVRAGELPSYVLKLIAGKDAKTTVRLLDSVAIDLRHKNFRLSTGLSKHALSVSKAGELKEPTVKMYLTLCRTYRTEGLYDTALVYVDSAWAFAAANNVSSQYANIADFEGLIWMRKGEYETAVRSFYKSIGYAEKDKDSIKLHDAFEHLGSVYFYRHDYKNAVAFYKKSLAYLTIADNPRRYFATLDNIGLGYSNLRLMDSALFYQKRGIYEIEKTKDSALIAESCVNIGSTLLSMKNFREAEAYLVRANRIHTLIHNEYGMEVSDLYLGRLFIESRQPAQALPHLERAYAIARKLKVAAQTKEVLSSLATAYKNVGDHKKATEHYQLLVNMMQQISEEENSRAINELSAQYETEKKQQQIQLLTSDKELQTQRIEKDRYIKLFILSVASLLLMLSLVFIFRFRKKKKDNSLLMEKNTAIALQKHEIEMQKEQLQHKNREITDSINYAKRIQGSVLPSQGLVQTLFPESFVYFQPKDIVSGDFYWLSRSKGYIYLAVADCTGHGVPGAMMSMLGAGLLNQIILSSKVELPSDILKKLHYHVLRSLNENMKQRESKDGMDIALIRIDQEKKEVVYSGGNRALHLVKNGTLITYKPDKQSIGENVADTATISYQSHRIDVSEPVQLYLFSDGVTDQFGGPKGKKLMTRNLLELLTRLSPLPMAEQEAQFTEAFESWKKGYEQTDDITLVSLRLS